jgi:hypothetical protein
MKPGSVDVRARSIYDNDRFELILTERRPRVVHASARGKRGPLAAVYVTARDQDGVVRVELFSSLRLREIFTAPMTDRVLARFAEVYATRKMLNEVAGVSAPSIA